ncbi:MAG: tetratricopeptide repeat protein [Archangiaceae bacterium]|nr:tetratricopeptide repeat protein [Archangiaceae bacterium]
MRWSLLLPTVLAMGPFEKNHPLVDDGEAAFERGDYEQALQKFDLADKEVPNNAQVAFDRGTALHKLGRNEDARAAFMRAAELNGGKQPLESKIHYNLGNSWASTSNKKEAIAEYRKALRKDPFDELARHNIEVLLKDLPPPQSQNAPDGGSNDGGRGDAGRPDAGADGGKPADAGKPEDGGRGDAGNGDGGADAGSDGGQGQGDGGRGDGGQGDGGQGQGEAGRDGGGQGGEHGDGGADGGAADADAGMGDAEAAEAGDGGEEMSKKEAERMLDSLKNNERNLQLWRFRPPNERKRKANEKDW